ncbi:hypothetical protein D3C87_1233980 [compost metagenome]
MTSYKDEDAEYSYFRSENLVVPDERQKNTSPSGDQLAGFMRCYGNTSLQEVYLRNFTYHFHGVFGDPKKVYGLIQFEGPRKKCSLELSEDNYQLANRWKHQIRSKHMDIDVNIGNEGRILGIKFIKISKDCHVSHAQTSGREVWMGEENFSSAETITNSHAPNSFIRRQIGK